ncbi:MAG: hypothetical protein IH588_09670 [Anaerolineales bacterium]|nr:hypothetical protein [Anaerolineales bacterium]
MENEDPLIVRVGTFFMVMGLGAFVLFVTSDIADQVDFDYLFIAMLLLGVGWGFRRKKAPPPPAGRFEYLRKLRNKNKGSEKSNQK